MNSGKISASQALLLIAEGKSVDPAKVEVTDELDAMDAFQLRKSGVEVPDELITYHDEDLAYDEDFDNYQWTKLDTAVDENEWNLQIELAVDPTIKDWIEKNNIKLSELLSSLLYEYYKTDTQIHKD